MELRNKMTISNLTPGESFKLNQQFPFNGEDFGNVVYIGERSNFDKYFFQEKQYLFAGKSEKYKSGIIIGIPIRSAKIEKDEIDFSKYTFLSLIPAGNSAMQELEDLLSGEEETPLSERVC